jgi:hypothetical protein
MSAQLPVASPPRAATPSVVLRRAAVGLGMLLGRSLFPLLTVAIIGGTVLWGPWVTLALALACFGAVSILA